MNHNDYLFSIVDGEATLLRRFEDMYRNCEDPHMQSAELERVDYQLATAILGRLLGQPRRGSTMRVLDIGCGLGYFTAHIKQLFPHAEVSGCDISATAIAKAKSRAPQCEFLQLDLKSAASLPERTYDVLLAMQVLCYFTEDEITEVLRNLRRLLNPRGHLMVGYHLPEQMTFGRYLRGLADAKRLLEPLGFSFLLSLDLVNALDRTYTGDPVGRNLYFLAQRE